MSESNQPGLSSLNLSDLTLQPTHAEGPLGGLFPVGFMFIFTIVWMGAVGVIVFLASQAFGPIWLFLFTHFFAGIAVLIQSGEKFQATAKAAGLKTELNITVDGAIVRWRRSKAAAVVLLIYLFQVIFAFIPLLSALALAGTAPNTSLLPFLGTSTVVLSGVVYFIINRLPFVLTTIKELSQNELEVSFQTLQFSKKGPFSTQTGTIDPLEVEIKATEQALILSPPEVVFLCSDGALNRQIAHIVHQASRGAKRLATPAQPIPEELKRMLQPKASHE